MREREDKDSVISYSSFNEKQRVRFIQISHDLTDPGSILRAYYEHCYSKMEGYYMPKHFMEIPLWIAIISGMMPDECFEKSVFIVDNIESAKISINTEKDEVLFFSAMDVNLRFIKDLVGALSHKIAIIGGYVNKNNFVNYRNVIFLDRPEELSRFFMINTQGVPDYKLFQGEKCVPRLALSSGCLFSCSFCTVPRILSLRDERQILAEVESFSPLEFRVVYLDDKTFGQAQNYRFLEKIKELILRFNPNFFGFTVQTTPAVAIKNGFLDELKDMGVRYIELGVEIVDDKFLSLFNKPYRVKHLNPICDTARKLGIKIIPNLIMGIPQVDYSSTITWIQDNKDIIPMVNIYFLSDYEGKHSDLPVVGATEDDRNENSLNKSWLTEEDITKIREAIREIFFITSGFDLQKYER